MISTPSRRAPWTFQSTPPARGATRRRYSRPCSSPYFNPRPPRGGRQRRPKNFRRSTSFQSTPPARGATWWPRDGYAPETDISIHAPREGGDGGGDVPIIHKGNFNPRPPRGGRRIPAADLSACRPFQSTPPARGATLLEVNKMVKIRIISIHAPREGGDGHITQNSGNNRLISIHAPREGGDFNVLKIKPTIALFQSTPPARGATHRLLGSKGAEEFQSTPPARGATGET